MVSLGSLTHENHKQVIASANDKDHARGTIFFLDVLEGRGAPFFEFAIAYILKASYISP